MVKLAELAVACFAYDAMTSYGDALSGLGHQVGREPDFLRPEHRESTLKWLNQWGCRQFALAYHGEASTELLNWYQEVESQLPDRDRPLWEYDAFELPRFSVLFDSLSHKQASIRKRAKSSTPVTFGSTGASKILFVLRPQMFVAWDELIRAKLGYDGSGQAYVRFLLRLREELLDLQAQCHRCHFALADLPAELERPGSTPLQLLGEFYWVTLTRQVAPPSKEQVGRWLQWFDC